MKVMQLYRELVAAGWTGRRMTVLAARYYLGLETTETLSRYRTAGEVETVIASR